MTIKNDYRLGMSDAQLRSELCQLEKSILRLTGDPLGQGSAYNKFYRWCSNKNSVEKVEEMMADRSYILELLFEKHCTPAEVIRLEQLNELLREMTYRTYKRTANLLRNALMTPREELDDDLIVDGKLVPEFDLPSSILRLADDNYYGSDFVRMAAILQVTEEYKPGMADIHCYPRPEQEFHAGMTDKELGCDNHLDDEFDNWTEAWLAIEPLKHIKVCYALHALVTHLNYSIPDVLRINNFKIETTLTVQQYSDQMRNRYNWWYGCDVIRLKEVLLKEAESRQEGLPLESFILQRCLDYFDEWAEEALTEVGLTDIDLYLQTVYNKANRIEQ